MRFFFCGTLVERELLQRVLQRPVSRRALKPTRLAGWRRCAISGRDFRGIVRCRGAVVEGLILDHVSATDRDKLAVYEGDGYAMARAIAELRDGPRCSVVLFAPRPGFYSLTKADWPPSKESVSLGRFPSTLPSLAPRNRR